MRKETSLEEEMSPRHLSKSHLRHSGSAMGVKNGNQDRFTNHAQDTSIPLD